MNENNIFNPNVVKPTTVENQVKGEAVVAVEETTMPKVEEKDIKTVEKQVDTKVNNNPFTSNLFNNEIKSENEVVKDDFIKIEEKNEVVDDIKSTQEEFVNNVVEEPAIVETTKEEAIETPIVETFIETPIVETVTEEPVVETFIKTPIVEKEEADSLPELNPLKRPKLVDNDNYKTNNDSKNDNNSGNFKFLIIIAILLLAVIFSLPYISEII